VDDSQIHTEYSCLKSVVVTNESETIKLPINEPAYGLKKSQIQEYSDFHGGPGVQHIAVTGSDIVQSVKVMKKRGVKFLDIPDSYYDDLEKRLKTVSITVKESLADLRKHRILLDFDENGYMLQIFTEGVQDRPTLFFEVIQRHNHNGFGVGNFKALFECMERAQETRGNL
jgi:4-hydroxyphenylpyruvate dioxygenase